MISKTSRTNFGATYMQIKPKSIDIKPQNIEIPSEPVFKKLNEIVSGPRCNWSAHPDKLPEGNSTVPSIAVSKHSSQMLTAKIGDEVFFITNEPPKDKTKPNPLHEMFMHIYKSAVDRL